MRSFQKTWARINPEQTSETWVQVGTFVRDYLSQPYMQHAHEHAKRAAETELGIALARIIPGRRVKRHRKPGGGRPEFLDSAIPRTGAGRVRPGVRRSIPMEHLRELKEMSVGGMANHPQVCQVWPAQMPYFTGLSIPTIPSIPNWKMCRRDNQKGGCGLKNAWFLFPEKICPKGLAGMAGLAHPWPARYV